MEEILGIGTDIIETARIRKAIERRGKAFIEKIYTPQEQNYCERFADPALPYAARFAAKEAMVKALGWGMRPPLTWTKLEILHDGLGKPIVELSEEVASLTGVGKILLSMSHCQEYAVAHAIAVR